MTGSPLGAFVAALAAVLAVLAGLALARARTPADMIAAFGAAGFMGGVATVATGEAAVGGAMIGATAMLAVLAHAAASRSRGSATAPKPYRAAIVAGGAGALVALAAWVQAPAATAPMAAPATGAHGADMLFAGMALLLGVAGVAAAILGRGERGVLGPTRGEEA